MSNIQWTEDSSVGVMAIDDQHKELLVITDTLFQAILADRGFDVLLGVLNELAQYVSYHFDFEEKLLKQHGYSAVEYKDHVDEHVSLKRQVAEYIEKYSESGGTLDMEVYNFLRDWTDEHLQRTDMKYKRFLKEKGVS